MISPVNSTGFSPVANSGTINSGVLNTENVILFARNTTFTADQQAFPAAFEQLQNKTSQIGADLQKQVNSNDLLKNKLINYESKTLVTGPEAKQMRQFVADVLSPYLKEIDPSIRAIEPKDFKMRIGSDHKSITLYFDNVKDGGLGALIYPFKHTGEKGNPDYFRNATSALLIPLDIPPAQK